MLSDQDKFYKTEAVNQARMAKYSLGLVVVGFVHSLTYTFVYTILSTLHSYKYFGKYEPTISRVLKMWSIVYALTSLAVYATIFLATKDYSHNNASESKKTNNTISKLEKSADMLRIVLAFVYFSCEVVHFIEHFKYLHFAKPIGDNLFSIHRIISMVVILMSLAISIVYTVEAGIKLHHSKKTNKLAQGTASQNSERPKFGGRCAIQNARSIQVISFAGKIVGLVSFIVYVCSLFIVESVKGDALHTSKQLKDIRNVLLIVSAVVGFVAACVYMYCEFCEKEVGTEMDGSEVGYAGAMTQIEGQ